MCGVLFGYLFGPLQSRTFLERDTNRTPSGFRGLVWDRPNASPSDILDFNLGGPGTVSLPS